MSSTRPERVAEAIRDELSQLIAKDLHDPGIGFLTLTRVSVTPDLQQARIYYTSLGDEKVQAETAKALTRATPFLRRQIGARIRLRRVPELTFFYDKAIAQTDRIEQILQDLKAEEQSRSEGAAATEPRERSGASDEARAERSEPGGAQGSPPIGDERSGEPGAPASERVGGSGGAKPPGQG